MNLSPRLWVCWILAASPVLGQDLGQRSWPNADHFRAFLERADIVARTRLATGVTESVKVTLNLQGETHQAIFKKIDQPNDSWRHEVAAYELDKLLGLGMVPPTVRRKDRGKLGCLQLWVDGKTLDALAAPPADLEHWRQQVSAMWLFDYLTANNDRHKNNVLASPEDRLLMIDNSRSLAPSATPLRAIDANGGATRALFWITDYDSELEQYPTTYSAELVGRLQSLSDRALKTAIGSYIDRSQRRQLLERRDTILQRIRDRSSD